MVQIGLSTNNHIISKIIGWFTKSKWGHSFITFEMYGRTFVMESDFPQVHIVTWERFIHNKTEWKLFSTGLKTEDLAPLWDKLGLDYDVPGLVGGIWVTVGRWLKHKWYNPLHVPGAMVCTALVVYLMRQYPDKFPGNDVLMDNGTSPGDLDNFLSK